MFDHKAIYYKVTNPEECHHRFQYNDGLNILQGKFQEQGSYVAGGLYFTDLDHIWDFLGMVFL